MIRSSQRARLTGVRLLGAGLALGFCATLAAQPGMVPAWPAPGAYRWAPPLDAPPAPAARPAPPADAGLAPRPGGSGVPARMGARFARSTTADGYVLDIALSGLPPEAVKIAARGRALLVRVEHSSAARDTWRRADGGAGHEYRYFSGTGTRRFALPPDADARAMRRETTGTGIRIIVPRRSN